MKNKKKFDRRHLHHPNSVYKGDAFILIDLESGDCIRFQTLQEFKKRLKQLNINMKNINSVKKLLELDDVKEKFKLFAYEKDLLFYAEDLY